MAVLALASERSVLHDFTSVALAHFGVAVVAGDPAVLAVEGEARLRMVEVANFPLLESGVAAVAAPIRELSSMLVAVARGARALGSPVLANRRRADGAVTTSAIRFRVRPLERVRRTGGMIERRRAEPRRRVASRAPARLLLPSELGPVRIVVASRALAWRGAKAPHSVDVDVARVAGDGAVRSRQRERAVIVDRVVRGRKALLVVASSAGSRELAGVRVVVALGAFAGSAHETLRPLDRLVARRARRLPGAIRGAQTWCAVRSRTAPA